MPSTDPPGIRIACAKCGATGPVRDSIPTAIIAWNLRSSDGYPKSLADSGGFVVALAGVSYLLDAQQAAEWLAVLQNRMLETTYQSKSDLLAKWGLRKKSHMVGEQMTL